MIVNYHTHTKLCGHASGEIREYVEEAIKVGFRELGFSEHAPMPFPKNIPTDNLNKLLSMRLKENEMDYYISTLLDVREEYKNDIKIHIGLEVEYFDCCFESFLDFIKPYPVCYLILGQHFGDCMQTPLIHFGRQFKSDELLKNYVDMAIDGIKTGKFSYVAHPDLPFYCRNIETYVREMTRLIKCANEYKLPLEINFYGLQEVRNYPTLIFWQIASDIGCDVIFGSDAHLPQNMKNPFALQFAKKLISDNPKLNLLEKIDFRKIN